MKDTTVKTLKQKKQSKKTAYQNILNKVLEFELLYNTLPEISKQNKQKLVKQINSIFQYS
jgi:hypothetical protein